jgi:hypothetical protein
MRHSNAARRRMLHYELQVNAATIRAVISAASGFRLRPSKRRANATASAQRAGRFRP